MNKLLLNHCMKWALAFAAIEILNFICVQVFNLFFLSFLFEIALIVFIVFVTINARKTCNNNSFTYGQCFKYIFRLYFFASFVFALFVLVYILFINKTFLFDTYMKTIGEYEQIFESIDMELPYETIELLYTPKFYILSVFLDYIFAGVFGALFFSIFLRKSQSIFSNNSVEETNDVDTIDNNKEE